MTPPPTHQDRGPIDRRRRPPTAWDAFRPRGRRIRRRRVQERHEPYFVDLIDGSTFGLAVLLLLLTVIDGAVTLVLLGAGCEEINPAMGYLLRQGPTQFLLGKYLLTTAGLPFLLVFRHFPLFGTRFRVGYLLPVFVGLYLVLLGYQLALINAPDDPGRDGPGDNVRLMSYIPPGPRGRGRPTGPLRRVVERVDPVDRATPGAIGRDRGGSPLSRTIPIPGDREMQALVIDDSRAMRAILGRILRNAGFEVKEAEHGLAGLDRLREEPRPDLVLVDWNMPEMDGLAFLKAVRSDGGFGDVRLVVVTTETEIGRMSEALAEGAHDYVMKPFTQDVILRTLDRLGLGTRAR